MQSAGDSVEMHQNTIHNHSSAEDSVDKLHSQELSKEPSTESGKKVSKGSRLNSTTTPKGASTIGVVAKKKIDTKSGTKSTLTKPTMSSALHNSGSALEVYLKSRLFHLQNVRAVGLILLWVRRQVL